MLTYDEILKVLYVAGLNDAAVDLGAYVTQDPRVSHARRTEVTDTVNKILGYATELPGCSPGWKTIEPLSARDTLANHRHAMAWAVATLVREAMLIDAGRRMIAAGHLICPRCGANGQEGDDPFYFLETMDSRRSCGVVLHKGPVQWALHTGDDYQDDFEGGRDERVCCESCGCEFELPAGVLFEYGHGSDELNEEIAEHQERLKADATYTEIQQLRAPVPVSAMQGDPAHPGWVELAYLRAWKAWAQERPGPNADGGNLQEFDAWSAREPVR